MNTIVDLNQNWTITGIGENGETVGPITATVPGHVHTDLLRHGIIPDPMWRDQALQSQWIEAFDWIYETEFHWPTEADTRSATIIFDGLDTIAAIELNGKLLGTAQNMLIGHTFSAAEALLPGVNKLRVSFTAVPAYLQDKDTERYDSLFSQDRVFVRRMQCTFGWDWVHRLVSYGIWRPAYIVSKPLGFIGSRYVTTTALSGNAAKLAWEVEVKDFAEGSHLLLKLTDPAGEIVWENTLPVDQEKIGGEIALNDPQLWWPSGYGDANLYTFTSELLASDGSVCDRICDEIGIRTVEIEQLPDTQGVSFTIIINGERIFAKGGNWVPADPFPATVTKMRYDQLLQTVVDGHMNMLRVWGGGTYELPDFWSACNRLGIMVSLDFMMACAQYPESEQWFVEAMKTEVEASIRELRNHPSLIFWCGDNELAMNNNPEDKYWGKSICAEVTAPLCARLDHTRPFLPTSPYGGRPFNSQDEGDCHYSAWYDAEFLLGDMTDYRERISQGRGRFLSESAIPGSPRLSSLLKMMTLEDVADKSAVMWEFRTKDNPYNGVDELTHYRLLEKTANRLFGESRSPEEKVRKMEYVQYEFERLQGEHYRQRKYQTSGLLFWMYNDCWPASGWSMVDYFGLPKAGYFGAKKAFRPVMVSIEDKKQEIGIWLVNDTLEAHRGEIIVRSAKTDGPAMQVCRFKVEAPVNCAILVGTLDKEKVGLAAGTADTVVQASWYPEEQRGEDTTDEEMATDRAFYFEVLPGDLQYPQTTLNVRHHPNDDHSGIIEIHTEYYARVVTIEDELLVEDNYFDMMPNEIRRLAYKTKPGQLFRGMPIVTCWNGSIGK